MLLLHSTFNSYWTLLTIFRCLIGHSAVLHVSLNFNLAVKDVPCHLTPGLNITILARTSYDSVAATDAANYTKIKLHFNRFGTSVIGTHSATRSCSRYKHMKVLNLRPGMRLGSVFLTYNDAIDKHAFLSRIQISR